MTVVASASRGVGVAILLVPLPFVIALLVGATRSDRVDTFLLWLVGLSLLPAIWLTALRVGWSGCAECLPRYQHGAMQFVVPAVPLLVAAMIALVARRTYVATGLIVGAQVFVAIGLAKVNTTGLVLIIGFIAIEALYLAFRTISQRAMANVSAGNGRRRQSVELSS